MPAYVSILVEVSVYAVFSIYIIGWSCGSICFLCSIVPIIIYFGCFIFKGSQRWVIALMLALNFVLYTSLYIIFKDRQPVVEVEDGVRTVLIIFSSFVMIFSMIFYNVLYIYASEFERKSLEQKNQKLSADVCQDALTGLMNRRGFLPIVDTLMNTEANCHFCVAFSDIDNFKRVNDTYGHDCGDEVLRHVSNMIVKEMNGCEICRWGGEEIVILMRDHDFAVAKQKMEYVRKFIESTPTIFYNKRIPVTVTIGLMEYDPSYKTSEEVIKVADERMYYGKQHGKNILICEDHLN